MNAEDKMEGAEDEETAFKPIFRVGGPEGASFGFLVDQQKTGGFSMSSS